MANIIYSVIKLRLTSFNYVLRTMWNYFWSKYHCTRITHQILKRNPNAIKYLLLSFIMCESFYNDKQVFRWYSKTTSKMMKKITITSHIHLIRALIAKSCHLFYFFSLCWFFWIGSMRHIAYMLKPQSKLNYLFLGKLLQFFSFCIFILFFRVKTTFVSHT